MAKYLLASEEDRAKYAPELVGQGHFIVSDGEKFWVVKHSPGLVDIEKREMLGYLLGRKFSNVAEVRLLNQEEHEQIKTLTGKGEDSTLINTCLVRLGGSYSIDELPCKTVEKATAAELVYSIWIRRRDTHADNRVYINGIPVFFDHHVALLGEHEQADISTFFNPQPASYGHAGAWRVRELQETPTTTRARTGNKALHFVKDLSLFKKQISVAKKELFDGLGDNWEELVQVAGFTDTKRDNIVALLRSNLTAIDNNIAVMEGIIYQP